MVLGIIIQREGYGQTRCCGGLPGGSLLSAEAVSEWLYDDHSAIAALCRSILCIPNIGEQQGRSLKTPSFGEREKLREFREVF